MPKPTFPSPALAQKIHSLVSCPASSYQPDNPALALDIRHITTVTYRQGQKKPSYRLLRIPLLTHLGKEPAARNWKRPSSIPPPPPHRPLPFSAIKGGTDRQKKNIRRSSLPTRRAHPLPFSNGFLNRKVGFFFLSLFLSHSHSLSCGVIVSTSYSSAPVGDRKYARLCTSAYSVAATNMQEPRTFCGVASDDRPYPCSFGRWDISSARPQPPSSDSSYGVHDE